MRNTEMIPMKEVLRLVHLKNGYGKDDFSQEVFRILDENGNSHYLINDKKMRQYINNYIDRKYKELNGCLPLTDKERNTIIKIEGSTQGTRYNKNDILKMLEDAHVKKLLFNRLKRRCVYHGETPIPLELSRYEIAKANRIISEKDQILFYEMIKNDSLDGIKEKLNILKKTIEMIETINEMVEEENQRLFKELEESISRKEEFEKIIEEENQKLFKEYRRYQKEIKEMEKQEIEKIIELEKLISGEIKSLEDENFEEVTESRSPESLYYYNEE